MSYRWALHHRGLLGVIEELVVSAPVQGHGIGSRLVDHGLELARQRGVVDVEVVSALARERAHRFYERRGFARRSLVLTHPLGSGA
jgi:GNAT superfamily N-acetyltransferase